MTGRGFERLFGGPARRPESPLTQRECDLAASVQHVTEEIMLRMARHAHAVTGCQNLCLAGGVALNCVGNGRILRDGPFERLWVQPAAGDAGGALGVAMLIWHQLLGSARSLAVETDHQHGSLLGPRFHATDITRVLDECGATYEHIPDEAALCDRVAAAIADEQVVGWFQGGMEFGPRALGARSILGDARSPRMQSVMNLKTKFRESFRPFAPSVLAEHAGEYFDGIGGASSRSGGHESPYMLLVSPVRADRLSDGGIPVKPDETQTDVLTRVNEVRSQIPAVTHVDNSARVQTVDAARNPRYHRLLAAFHARTGCPVVINTSFNVRGEPIVCTPLDAYRCFMATNMDVLVLGDFILEKARQSNARRIDVDTHLAKFELD
jgi:carbamoyltransferase